MNTLLIRFIINLIFIALLSSTIYHVFNKKIEYIFNFVVFNFLIFFIASLLSNSNIETGFAFGIFAILSIIRYRTDPIPIKEMTYLFISIILGIINSTVSSGLEDLVIIFANVTILIVTLILELFWKKNYREVKEIIFEDITLVNIEKKEELKKVLSSRTGYTILDINIEKIDYLKDIAHLKVYIE